MADFGENIPLKYLVSYNDETLPESTPKDYEFDYVDISSVSNEHGIERFQQLSFGEAPSRARRIVQQNDIIVSTVRTYLKATAQIPKHRNPIIVSTGFVTLRANEKIDSNFLKYSVQSSSFVSTVEANSTGISYPAINASSAVSISIPVPPIGTQNIISSFLDNKCTHIDSLISNVQSQIEKLKAYKQSIITEAVTKGLDPNVPMKDSGVEWIGSISQNFCVQRLKDVAYILDQYRKPITSDKRNQEAEILYDYYGASGAIDKIDGFTIDDHVMLIGEDGANLRMRNLPLMYEVCGKAWINNHAHILKPKENICFKYLFYALEGLDINPYITGSAQPKLSQENLRVIAVPIPSYEQQRAIAEYIQGKHEQIDQLLAIKQAKIDKLNEYKKSLIYEYVTGKREVE